MAYRDTRDDPVYDTARQTEWHQARARHALRVDDVCEDLGDCDAQLLEAFRIGDAEIVGHIVLAVRNAGLDHLADIEAGYQRPRRPSMEDVAQRVLDENLGRVLELSVARQVSAVRAATYTASPQVCTHAKLPSACMMSASEPHRASVSEDT